MAPSRAARRSSALDDRRGMGQTRIIRTQGAGHLADLSVLLHVGSAARESPGVELLDKYI